MKVAILDRDKLNKSKFESELAIALQKSRLKGYALMGFNVNLGSKICEIDAIVILESGAFICLEAKDYTGKWTGSANDKWFCNGKEINSRGVNPFAQVLDYAYAVKNKLQTTFKDIELWINFYIVAPDRADFLGIEGAVINKYQAGKCINVCNISSLEPVLGDIWGNPIIAEIIEQFEIEQVISKLVGISTLRLQELTLPSKSSVILANSFAPINIPPSQIAEDTIERRITPKPILRKKSPVSATVPTKSQDKISVKSLLASLGILLTLISLASISFLGFKFWQFSTKPRIAAKSLTIGILDDPKKYESLKTYLGNELVLTDNFWEFVVGDRIKVNGDEKLSYEDAKAQIKKKQWDIAFTLSPMNSIYAKENNYYYLGRMYPTRKPYYQSVLFARKDRNINLIGNINSETVIALGSENSASTFYMPLYNLFTKTVKVKQYNRSEKIIEAVKSREADVGVARLEDVKKYPELKTIPMEKGKEGSRDIPGSGVYLSPNLSEYDRNVITYVMLQAPKRLQEESNYGGGEEVKYLQFSKIVEIADKIKKCSDFSKNPVKFFCPNKGN